MNIPSSYFMESEDEGKRLTNKHQSSKSFHHLSLTGFHELNNNSIVIDAGCGVGLVVQDMINYTKEKSMLHEYYLLDSNNARLKEAKENLSHYPQEQLHFYSCYLHDIPLENETADYVFCRFVFEYISNQEEVFKSLLRLVKPGGKLVIGDLDYNCLTHYPINSRIQMQLNEVVKKVQSSKLFDFYAGRKLPSIFNSEELENIKIHFEPWNLSYGSKRKEDINNWESKLNQFISLEKKGLFSVSFDLELFKEEVMEMVLSQDHFCYTPLILMEGRKKL